MDNELHKKLNIIINLLVIIAIGAFAAGRAAIIEHGAWKILGL